MSDQAKGAVPMRPGDDSSISEASVQPFDSFSTGAQEARLSKELAALQLQLKEDTKKLVSQCSSCEGVNIHIKTSIHMVGVGNNIFGLAGSGPSYITHADFLYCDDCGTVFYKRSVEGLERLIEQIREKDDELSRLRNPRRC